MIEKDITTPDYYPLSLNALVNACNQKNNRDPVMGLDESSVRTALYNLQEKRLAGSAGGADSRVTKYQHRLQEGFNFTPPETAIPCVLPFRGPQTRGARPGRGDRRHGFKSLEVGQPGRQPLRRGEPPLAKILPRQPGTKEARYAHLLSGDIEVEAVSVAATSAATPSSAGEERIAHLETEVAELRVQIAEMKQQLAQFRKQFE